MDVVSHTWPAEAKLQPNPLFIKDWQYYLCQHPAVASSNRSAEVVQFDETTASQQMLMCYMWNKTISLPRLICISVCQCKSRLICLLSDLTFVLCPVKKKQINLICLLAHCLLIKPKSFKVWKYNLVRTYSCCWKVSIFQCEWRFLRLAQKA